MIALGGCSGDTATIVRGDDEVAAFCIDTARTAEERANGLRGVEALCANCGLAIEFPQVTEACIENDGVNFALDVAYFDSSDVLVAIERDVPADDATSRCHSGVLRVLELNAHVGADLRLGDKIVL